MGTPQRKGSLVAETMTIAQLATRTKTMIADVASADAAVMTVMIVVVTAAAGMIVEMTDDPAMTIVDAEIETKTRMTKRMEAEMIDAEVAIVRMSHVEGEEHEMSHAEGEEQEV